MISKQILLIIARALWAPSAEPAGLVLPRVSLIASVLGRDRLVQAACEIVRACNPGGEGVEQALCGIEDVALGRINVIKVAPLINAMDLRIRPLFDAVCMDRVSAASEIGVEQVAAYVVGALFHAAQDLASTLRNRDTTFEEAFSRAKVHQAGALRRLVSLGELERAIEALPS